MTKSDIRNIIDIIDDEIEEQKRLAEGFVKLNPTYERERNKERDCAIEALIGARIAIIEKYKRIWKEEG